MKKYLFGLFAVALAIAFSAFTAPVKNTKSTVQTWYFIDGSNSNTGDPQYWEQFPVPIPECDESEIVCSVEFEPSEDPEEFNDFLELVDEMPGLDELKLRSELTNFRYKE